MTSSAKSIYYFAIYLVATCLILVISPNTFLMLMNLPETSEVWIRIVGILAGAISIYYFTASKYNYVELIKASVPVRLGVFVFFGLCVLLKWVSPGLLLVA